eukprot:1910171-Pleurochrysis_carterae.AAC.1
MLLPHTLEQRLTTSGRRVLSQGPSLEPRLHCTLGSPRAIALLSMQLHVTATSKGQKPLHLCTTQQQALVKNG